MSDCELVEAKDFPEKVPTGGGTNTFAIFNLVPAQKVAPEKIRQKNAGNQPLNPPCSELEMIDLKKRRWVCVSDVHFKFKLN